jgi:hypothetical protein
MVAATCSLADFELGHFASDGLDDANAFVSKSNTVG